MVSSLFVIISETGASSVDCTLAGWLGWASFTSTNRLRLFLEFGWLKVFIPVDGGRNGAERGERSPSAPSRFAGRCSVASAAALFPLPSPDREVAGNRSIPFDHDASDRRWNGGSFRYVASSQLLLSPLLLLLPVGKESIPTKEKMAAAPLSIITNDFFYLFISLLHNHSHALSFLRNTDIFGRLLSIHSMENDKEKTRKRQLKENKGIKVNTVCNTKGKGKQKKNGSRKREIPKESASWLCGSNQHGAHTCSLQLDPVQLLRRPPTRSLSIFFTPRGCCSVWPTDGTSVKDWTTNIYDYTDVVLFNVHESNF